MKLDHIQRIGLPWHPPADKTECGRSISDVQSVTTREALIAKVKREGQQRALYTTCQTCLNTAQRHPTWDQNPMAATARHFQGGVWGPKEDAETLTNELRAIEALIAAHRDEFDAMLAGLASAPNLAARRADAERRSWR